MVHSRARHNVGGTPRVSVESSERAVEPLIKGPSATHGGFSSSSASCKVVEVVPRPSAVGNRSTIAAAGRCECVLDALREAELANPQPAGGILRLGLGLGFSGRAHDKLAVSFAGAVWREAHGPQARTLRVGNGHCQRMPDARTNRHRCIWLAHPIPLTVNWARSAYRAHCVQLAHVHHCAARTRHAATVLACGPNSIKPGAAPHRPVKER